MIEADQGGSYPLHAATATECDNKTKGDMPDIEFLNTCIFKKFHVEV